MTYYARTRARKLELARLYREKNREEINRKLYFHGETNASK